MNLCYRDLGKWFGCTLLVYIGMAACHQGKHDEKPSDAAAKAPVQEPAPEAEGTGFLVGEPPAGGDVYQVVAAETDVSFVIVSNSAGAITGHFPQGTAGWLNLSDQTGKFAIQLDTLKTTNEEGLEVPLRDANVVEAFFGVRPSALFAEAVDAAWAKLEGMLPRNVALAGFEVTGLEGVDASLPESSGSINGRLVLWNKVNVDASFAVKAISAEGRLELSSSEPVTIDLAEVLGENLRNLVFETMLAAGCAHQPGIQNQVAITLEKVVLQKAE